MDRRVGRAVMAAVPVVGACLGIAGALLAWGLSRTDTPDTLIGVLVVALLALLTRGMHLDGLADTADGLGCYGPPTRVTEVMRSGTVGPFGVATLILILAIEAVGFGALTSQNRWWELGLAIAVARVAAVFACRWTLRPAHQDGFGSLVVGTQRFSLVAWTIVVGVASVATGGVAPGPADETGLTFDTGSAMAALATTGVMLTVTWLFTGHCARRMGGLSGDVLGAVIELGTAIMLIGLLL